mgnify:CR=1 FL=1
MKLLVFFSVALRGFFSVWLRIGVVVVTRIGVNEYDSRVIVTVCGTVSVFVGSAIVGTITPAHLAANVATVAAVLQGLR